MTTQPPHEMGGLPPLDIIDLRVLVALANEQHFARAASSCHLSQPALSARIRRMEQALGTPLVQRGHRFLGFTQAGERILARARRVLADLDRLRQDVTGGQDLAGRLRLASIPSATPLAGQIAAVLARQHPAIETACASLTSRRIEAGLHDFTVDAGITYLNNEPLTNVDTLALMPERYCIVSALDHTGLPPDMPMEWRDAAACQLALLTSDMQNRRILDRAFQDVNAQPNVVFESNSFLSILGHLKTTGVGVAAILPDLIVRQFDTRGLHVHALAAMGVEPVIGLVAPKRDLHLPLTSALWRTAAAFATGIDNGG